MNIEQTIGAIMGMVKGQNPLQLLANLCMKDPGIKRFVENAQGKSPEQLCRECGIDPAIIKRFVG